MNKKLCLLIPSLHAGGMERVMSLLADYYAAKIGLEVHLVMFGIKPELFYPLPKSVIIHQPEFIFNNNYRTWYTLRSLLFLRKQIRKLSPDSILSFGEYWNNFVLLALFGTKYAVFVSDRCQPDKSLGRFHDTLRRFLYPRAKGVIVQTQIAREIYQKNILNSQIYVIGNPIRDAILNKTENRENIILSVGRLIRSKHQDELIRLFVKINAPNWKLYIVGGDALKQNNFNDLKKLVDELDAKDKVILTGTIENVDDYYRKSKIFAFTSSSEGFPNAIGEALSYGLPVVAFDCIAGPSEMITDGKNGYLVPLFDYNLFKKKLNGLMQDDKLRMEMSKEAVKIYEKFSRDSIADSILKIILK